jgi:hypothetical protein
MDRTIASRRFSAFLLAAAALLAGCADQDELPSEPTLTPAFAAARADYRHALATLRRVTARYHDLDAALADGFVLLHPCEERPGEGPVGAVYAHFGRVLDGVIDPAAPDALIYEPSGKGRARLVGVEFAIPMAMTPEPPVFFGAEFQAEEEFGVYALHAWVWRKNPEGMFAESNPRVSCDAQ